MGQDQRGRRGIEVSSSDDSGFDIYAPLRFFEKSGGERRIAGVISTDNLDRQGEKILQDGLDFTPFMTSGWFNDDHRQGPGAAIGFPEKLLRFNKGETLPDGSMAKANCHWVEGQLIAGDPEAERLWTKGVALARMQAPRSLAFSIEGAVQRRAAANRKIVTAGVVQNVAITHLPVNSDSKLITLVKALSISGSTYSDAAESNPTEGGAVLSPHSLQGKKPTRVGEPEDEKKPKAKLSKGQYIDLLQSRFPGLKLQTAARMVELASQMKETDHESA